jgi:hypothetical protein
MLLINFLELGVVAARGRKLASREHAVNMPSPCRRDPATNCHGLEISLSERHIRGMAGERHDVCESDMAALWESNGKDTL